MVQKSPVKGPVESNRIQRDSLNSTDKIYGTVLAFVPKEINTRYENEIEKEINTPTCAHNIIKLILQHVLHD